MVIKDWKKIESKGVYSRWIKGNKRIEVYPHYLKVRGIIFMLIENNKVKNIQEFKTKPQALKFVKAYMKKH